MEQLANVAPSVADLAYAAGFFDGEGTISIVKTKEYRARNRRPQYQFSVSISQVTIEPLDSFVALFGGQIKPARRPSGKLMWRFVLTAKQAEDFLVAIRPYSLAKRNEIDIALEFRATMLPAAQSSKAGKVPPLTEEMLVRRDGIIARLSDHRRRKYA